MINNMHKVEFQPLTYIEVEQDKPLVIKLDDTHFFKCNLQKAMNFILFNSHKNVILERRKTLDEIGETNPAIDYAKIQCDKALIAMLYRISKPKGFFKSRKWFIYLNKLFMDNIVLMKSVFQQVLDYNSSIKKKALNLLNTDIFKGNVSDLTAGGKSLSDLVRTDPKTGEKYFEH